MYREIGENMSLDSFINKLSGLISNKAQENNKKIANQMSNPFNTGLDASVFSGANLDDFKAKIAEGMNLSTSDSIFYESINSAGVEDMFKYFDKDNNGVIEEDEIKEASSIDGNDKSFSMSDLNFATTSMQYQKIYDDYEKLLAEFKAQEAQAAQNSAGTAQYSAPQSSGYSPNYVSNAANTVAQAQKEPDSKEQLDKIVNEELPKLREEREEIIQKAQEEIDKKNEELDEVLEENEKELGELGENYTKTQDEIEKCDEKIDEYNTKISDSQTNLQSYQGELANLEGEYGALQTDTKDEKVNSANKQRKSELEGQIKDLKEKISKEEETIKDYQEKIKEQETIKAQKQDELSAIQEKIAQKNPQIAEKLGKIQEEIKQIEEKKTQDVKEIDEEIKTKETQANELQKEIGTKAGKDASGPYANYNSEKGQALAKNALTVRGTTGWCLAGVNDSLAETDGFGQRLSFEGAYQAIDALQGKVAGYENLASQFEEVSVDRNELSSLPAGAIVVWDRDPNNQWGHISIALGDGRESSDHIATQMTQRNAQYHVFIPV